MVEGVLVDCGQFVHATLCPAHLKLLQYLLFGGARSSVILDVGFGDFGDPVGGLQELDPAGVFERQRRLAAEELLANPARTRRRLESALAALRYFLVALHGEPRLFENVAVDVVPFGECALSERRLLGRFEGGVAGFLRVGVGGRGGRRFLCGALLLLDALRVLPDDLSVDLIALAERELLGVRGWPRVARQEVLGVLRLPPPNGGLDHPSPSK